MAHTTNIVVNGISYPVIEFDHTAQEIDDAVDLMGGVRPNLLDNAIFVGGGSQQGGGQLPINQQGETSYNGIGYYIDRWDGDRSTLTVTLNSDSLNIVANGGVGYIRQSFSNYFNGVYTFSALVKGSGTIYLNIGGTDGNTSSTGYTLTNDWTVFSQIFDTSNYPNTNLYMPYMRLNSGTNVNIKAIKLEKGNNQTLAYKTNNNKWEMLPQLDNDYLIQFTKCQRYQKIIKTSGTDVLFNGIITGSGKQFWCSYVNPVPFRVAPAVELSGRVIVRNISGYATDDSGSNYLQPTSITATTDFEKQLLILRFVFEKALGTNNTPGSLSLSSASGGSILTLNANL